MATIVFSALGTLLGGPIGGALGALAGRSIDSMIFGGGAREGPRLKDLSVTTSSYGSPLPRHFGRMRVPGTVIWSTELVEHRHKEGGGKGKPSVVTYNYTVSFAVALASRPILDIGRIWADGNLLRGAAGDLKVGGSLRLHRGGHDQAPDPLIASAEGADRCPAFRGVAYVVFEDLQLEEFGNRIPTLTFEVVADEGELGLSALFEDTVEAAVDAAVPLPGLAGLSCEGPLAAVLGPLDPLYPLDCDAAAGVLTIARERLQNHALPLSEAAVATADGDFGGKHGFTRRRAGAPANPLSALRYYDLDRDYQPGLQRASGRPHPGEAASVDLPAALAADDAKSLVEGAAKRDRFARETLSWRTTELDTDVAPGSVVSAPGHAGRWRVTEWEWRASGVELTLARLPPTGLAAAAAPNTDPGRPNLPADLLLAATALTAFELPWDGVRNGDVPAIFAAVSSAGAGWKGAALYADRGDGQLIPLGSSGRARATIGMAMSALPAAAPALADRSSAVTIQMLTPDMLLADATARQLAMGANRVLIGSELVQFGKALPLGGGQWRLEQLLRGRGGTEWAVADHTTGEPFVLLDASAIAVDAVTIGTAPDARIAAIGLADIAPVTAAIAGRGTTLRPLSPVHPRARLVGGDLLLSWTRRARGAWLWNDGVDAALNEETEAYEVAFGPTEAPLVRWETSSPELVLTAATLAGLAAALPAGAFHVRQRGTHAFSLPLLLTTLS